MHLSLSFLFILLVCFFFLISNASPFLPPHLQHTFALPSFNFSPPPPFPLFFSSLCLPREKRFCLLLVSAPSQSAFLISSYCFCLIFKCYPGPNGNPYKKKGVSEWREWRREKPAGYCVSLQDPETKASPPHPQGEIWWVFGGRGVRRVGVGGWVSSTIRRGDIFFVVSLGPPRYITIFFISFSFYLLSPDLPIALHFFPSLALHPIFKRSISTSSWFLLRLG